MAIDNNSPVEAQARTLADIEKNYHITGDSKAADAALCRMRDEREAREEARGRTRLFADIEPVVVPSSDIQDLVLGDLEVGVGEPEVIEDLSGLVTDDITDLERKLDESVSPAEVAESAKAEPEPEAVAPTVVELPAKVADWGKPLEFPDLPLVKFRRKSLRVINARIAKEKKLARTAKNTARKKRLRAAVAAKQPPRLPKPARFPVEVVTPEMRGHFYEYVSRGDTPLARSLRGRIRAKNLIIALEVYLDYAGQLGLDPKHKEFAKAMAWKPNGARKARRTVTVLSKVFAEGGFGTDADLAKWSAEHAEAEAAEFPLVDRETRGAGGL